MSADITYDTTTPFGNALKIAVGDMQRALATINRIATISLATADDGGGSPDWTKVVSAGLFGVADATAAQAQFTYCDAIRLAFGPAQQPGGALMNALTCLDKGG